MMPRMHGYELCGRLKGPEGIRGVCIGFRIEAQDRVVTYLGNHGSFVKLNGNNEHSRRQDADLVSFAKESDLLIGEAQYTEEEYPSRKGWGHSAFDDAVRCAVDAGAKLPAVFHHDPDHTDEMMDAYVEHRRAPARQAGGVVDCMATQDGLRIDL